MHELKLMMLPSQTSTRLVAKDAHGVTILRGQLPTQPRHPEAVPLLLEAIGGFAFVHAALVVPVKEPSLATTFYPGWFTDFGGAGYDLQSLRSSRRERRQWWGR